MNPHFIVSNALRSLCVLFGGQSCDHCDYVAHCRSTSADTAQCVNCDAAMELDYGRGRPVRTLGTIDGAM